MRPPKKYRRSDDPLYGIESVASAMEYTGAIPSAVLNDSEAEAYSALLAIRRQKPQQQEDPNP